VQPYNDDATDRADQLRRENPGASTGADTSKLVSESATQGNRGVCKRSRCGKPAVRAKFALTGKALPQLRWLVWGPQL
jgi:hypothetical protein